MGRSLVTLVFFGLILLGGQLDRLPNLQPTVRVPHVEAPVCKPNPKDHVYNPDRLKLIDPCIQVTGTVELVRLEPDGDYHVLLKLDPGFADLINDGNRKLQRGDLVLEPVCENAPTQEDAKATCADAALGTVPKPTVGEHVVVIGPYVTDFDHSDWAEIHPAWEIEKID